MANREVKRALVAFQLLQSLEVWRIELLCPLIIGRYAVDCATSSEPNSQFSVYVSETVPRIETTFP